MWTLLCHHHSSSCSFSPCCFHFQHWNITHLQTHIAYYRIYVPFLNKWGLRNGETGSEERIFQCRRGKYKPTSLYKWLSQGHHVFWGGFSMVPKLIQVFLMRERKIFLFRGPLFIACLSLHNRTDQMWLQNECFCYEMQGDV